MFMRKWKSSAIVLVVLAGSSCSTSPQRYVDKGNGLLNAGRYDEADLNYQKAIQKDPGFGEAYYRLGLSEFQQGKVSDACAILTRASELLANRDDVLTALADASFAM